MNTALEQFETSLVHASRTLHTTSEAPTRVWHVRAALRRCRRRAPAGVLVIGALAAAGSTLLGPTGNPRTIAGMECGYDTMVAEVTDNPVSDCATLWPSLYHHPAPHLVAWVAESGGAVVVSAAETPPPGDGWRRLPSGWRADTSVIQLHDQLEDVAGGLAARTCWSASAAYGLVSSLLRADGLRSWKVLARSEPGDGQHRGCLTVAATFEVPDRLVGLIERRVQAPANGSFMTTGGRLERARFAAVERGVNRALSAPAHHCASVERAAGLWRSRASRAGLLADRYLVFAPSPTPGAAARCARVIVIGPGGGGPYDVYAAEAP